LIEKPEANEMPVILDNRMVDTKRILRENGGLRKTRDTRGC
jgi:hypothetical protein